MSAVETIALIVVIIGLLKILSLIFIHRSFAKFSTRIVKSQFFGVSYLLLAILVFYFLMKEISVVEILAVMVFTGLLMRAQFSRYPEEASNLVQRVMKDKKEFWKRNWIYIFIWVVLLILGLIELI